ncbi:hypothetical protein [Gracilibacillus phocaeensis]|uniref:hypothetical protein n=1 Tax=Gracilibacillus phocaeensis TaxID=2042304 RepID=UPI0013EF5736|nr:hypothetical protein [Gracilibacillus phocaeensis]
MHEKTLYHNGRSQTLLVVYQIAKSALSCPLRIDFEVIDYEAHEFKIYLIDQSGERTYTHIFAEKKQGAFYTADSVYMNKTLSELIAHFASQVSDNRECM